MTSLMISEDMYVAARQRALDESAAQGRTVTLAEVFRAALASHLDLPIPSSPRRGRPPKGTDLAVKRGEQVEWWQTKRSRPPKKS
jgi:hypothetical protein